MLLDVEACILQARNHWLMWSARHELLGRLWDRVEAMMLAQRGRARQGKPMTLRKRDALRRNERHINDTLANAEVNKCALMAS